VRRDEFDALAQLAANAREGQEAADTRIAALEARIAALEERLPVVNGPGMVA
jgi:BMFP domain-containing protein YqiC